MTDGNVPVEDDRRLAALRACGLLDSPEEPAFDRLTKLLCSALKVPVGLVSLVDADRQFFKSQCGLPEQVAKARQTPLSHSFCQHVVNGAEALVVEDARQHPLVCDNPSIQDLGVVAYLGVPIRDADGHVLGSLCAIDGKPRQWSAGDIDLLNALSTQLTVDMLLRSQSAKLANDLAAQRAKESDLTADLDRHRMRESDRRAMTRLNIHDLRTPLSAMMLGIDGIQLLGPLNEEQADYAAVCKRNCEALLNIVNTLLDIDNVDQHGGAALRREACRPADLVRAAVEHVQTLAREKTTALTTDIGAGVADVSADVDRIERVLVNLMGNSIKFSKPGSRVTARVSNAAEGQFVEFAVEDNGIGMADARHIFEEGVRLDATANTRRSTGLGLTFCKRIVEAHGGKIWVDSTPGVGSTFHFTLPRQSI